MITSGSQAIAIAVTASAVDGAATCGKKCSWKQRVGSAALAVGRDFLPSKSTGAWRSVTAVRKIPKKPKQSAWKSAEARLLRGQGAMLGVVYDVGCLFKRSW